MLANDLVKKLCHSFRGKIFLVLRSISFKITLNNLHLFVVSNKTAYVNMKWCNLRKDRKNMSQKVVFVDRYISIMLANDLVKKLCHSFRGKIFLVLHSILFKISLNKFEDNS